MGRCMFAVTFCPFNIECNRGLRSMIFYDELVILECDSRPSLSCYFFRYPNLIRHHTIPLRMILEGISITGFEAISRKFPEFLFFFKYKLSDAIDELFCLICIKLLKK